MKVGNPHDHRALRSQIALQKTHAWDIEADFPWDSSVDLNKYLLPLDEDAIAFPAASKEQKLALSQLMGLIVNSTIAEMEDVAVKLRDVAWREVLRSYPINPEMVELGEVFFDEEAKHALAFQRYTETFCKASGLDKDVLETILPKAYGSIFQKAIKSNAEMGGHAFWWVVAVVEEESVLIYQQIYRHRKTLDPLFFHVHRKHFEEESRHTNYAFLMLEVIRKRNASIRQKIHQKIDLLYSELFSTGWVLTELHKVMRVKDLQQEHELFKVLASCIPLFEKMSLPDLARRFFVSAPYVSSILNRRYHRYTVEAAKQHSALGLIYPQPKPAVTHTQSDLEEGWTIPSAQQSSAV